MSLVLIVRHISQHPVLETTPQPNGLAKSAPTTNHDTAGLGPSQEAVDAAGLTNLTSIEADHPATVAKEQPRESYSLQQDNYLDAL